MYSQDWLEDPTAIRGIFIIAQVSIGGINTVKYLANIGYLTESADVYFDPIVVGEVSYTEELSTDNSLSLSFGDIELASRNGEMDSWLTSEYAWVNKKVEIYYGDPRWITNNITDFMATFKLVYSGVISDIDSRNLGSINIKIKDKLTILDSPITTRTIGEYGNIPSDSQNIIPIVLGEVFNISPVLTNSAPLTPEDVSSEYIYSDGICEGLIELRDNGMPIYTRGSTTVIEATPTPSVDILITAQKVSGLYIHKPLVGTPTISVQGVVGKYSLHSKTYSSTTYSSKLTDVIVSLVTQYGLNTIPYQDLDTENLISFDTLNPVPVGIYISDTTTVLDACTQLLSSIGASMYFNRFGKLQILRLGSPGPTATFTSITKDHMLAGTFNISKRLPVTVASKLGFCKNWYVQSGLLTAIPEDDKEDFSIEYLYVTYTDSESALKYSLSSEIPTPIDTLLINRDDAITEATRRVTYLKEPKTVYSFTGTSALFSLELGQYVNLTHTRFNLQGGVRGQVISLTPNWTINTIEVEVII